MTKLGKGIIAVFVMSALIAGLFCCQRDEGPLERAGKKIDKAVEKAGEQVEKAGKKIENVAKGVDRNSLREPPRFKLPMAASPEELKASRFTPERIRRLRIKLGISRGDSVFWSEQPSGQCSRGKRGNSNPGRKETRSGGLAEGEKAGREEDAGRKGRREGEKGKSQKA